ncbi:CcmD family protein [Maridesulfovibrio ferrireducens]|uniref:CcmD family protein n=1 Tax=Maridesulfovibrio ferrireducens TaxID=246191 RepID=A0A1G9EE36_9BACT|nr:CcmD family protein [Maridesulfovibrio ferrireducens]SDK74331.1 CcmD family protein [Maridesulfovibrio ferrireducens]
MTNETYLLIGNIAVWAGIAGYLAFIAAKGVAMERRITQMEMLDNDK